MSEEKESRILTTQEACERLGMSRSTFFLRLKQFPDIKPINYNPNLARQRNAEWKLTDIDKVGVPVRPEITGRVA